MSLMTGKLLGGSRFELLHVDSGARITTDAPVDNHGEGTSFSPSDLCAVSLPACMCTIITLHAQQNGIALSSIAFSVEKKMSASPRRIGTLVVGIDLPASLSSSERERLEHAALTCPVHKSLHPDVELVLEFRYV